MFDLPCCLVQVPREGHSSDEAIHENQMDIVRLLVAHGANLNAVDNNGELNFAQFTGSGEVPPLPPPKKIKSCRDLWHPNQKVQCMGSTCWKLSLYLVRNTMDTASSISALSCCCRASMVSYMSLK